MYVVSYDIEKDKIRNKIAKKLEDYGKRVQYSVFECRINESQFSKLYESLSELMTKEKNGNIRFYNLCKNCETKIITIGIEKESMKEEDSLVII